MVLTNKNHKNIFSTVFINMPNVRGIELNNFKKVVCFCMLLSESFLPSERPRNYYVGGVLTYSMLSVILRMSGSPALLVLSPLWYVEIKGSSYQDQSCE